MVIAKSIYQRKEREDGASNKERRLVAIDGAEPSTDQDECALRQAALSRQSCQPIQIIRHSNIITGTYEYAAASQLAWPGPASLPSFSLKSNPPATVVKLEINYAQQWLVYDGFG